MDGVISRALRQRQLPLSGLNRQPSLMKNDLPQRLKHIESHLTHVERLHDELNEVVIEQGKLLKQLQTQVRRLSDSVETAELDRIKSTNPKPPHYQ